MNQEDKDWIQEMINCNDADEIIEWVDSILYNITRKLERIKNNAECNYTREELHKLIEGLKDL